MAFASALSLTDRNTDIPFFPSSTWNLVSNDFGKINLPTFSWIQAFYDASLAAEPLLAIFTGNFTDAGVPILSEVRFAYSGERINIKGSGIFVSGLNNRGQAVSSTTIGVNPVADLSRVIAWGGMR